MIVKITSVCLEFTLDVNEGVDFKWIVAWNYSYPDPARMSAVRKVWGIISMSPECCVMWVSDMHLSSKTRHPSVVMCSVVKCHFSVDFPLTVPSF